MQKLKLKLKLKARVEMKIFKVLKIIIRDVRLFSTIQHLLFAFRSLKIYLQFKNGTSMRDKLLSLFKSKLFKTT